MRASSPRLIGIAASQPWWAQSAEQRRPNHCRLALPAGALIDLEVWCRLRRLDPVWPMPHTFAGGAHHSPLTAVARVWGGVQWLCLLPDVLQNWSYVGPAADARKDACLAAADRTQQRELSGSWGQSWFAARNSGLSRKVSEIGRSAPPTGRTLASASAWALAQPERTTPCPATVPRVRLGPLPLARPASRYSVRSAPTENAFWLPASRITRSSRRCLAVWRLQPAQGAVAV